MTYALYRSLGEYIMGRLYIAILFYTSIEIDIAF